MSRKNKKTNYRTIKVTEELWLSFDDPDVDLFEKFWPWINSIQWQLYAAGCCRQIENLMRDERSRNVIFALEQHANQRLTTEQLRAVSESAHAAADEVYVIGVEATDNQFADYQAAATAARACEVVYFPYVAESSVNTKHEEQSFPRIRARIAASVTYSAVEAAIAAARHAADPSESRRTIWNEVGARERLAHCDRLRDIVGNPFPGLTNS